MTHLLSYIASLVGRRPRAATLAVLLAVTALIGGAVAVGGSFKDDFTVPGIESQQAQNLLEKRFEAQSGTQAVVVFSAGDGALERPGPKREIQTALAKIARQPHVAAVEDPFHTAGRLSDDGRTAFATVSYDQTATDLDSALATASRTPPPASIDPASTSPCRASRSTEPPRAGSRSER